MLICSLRRRGGRGGAKNSCREGGGGAKNSWRGGRERASGGALVRGSSCPPPSSDGSLSSSTTSSMSWRPTAATNEGDVFRVSDHDNLLYCLWLPSVDITQAARRDRPTNQMLRQVAKVIFWVPFWQTGRFVIVFSSCFYRPGNGWPALCFCPSSTATCLSTSSLDIHSQYCRVKHCQKLEEWDKIKRRRQGSLLVMSRLYDKMWIGM